jgi:hypothetical protein
MRSSNEEDLRGSSYEKANLREPPGKGYNICKVLIMDTGVKVAKEKGKRYSYPCNRPWRLIGL